MHTTTPGKGKGKLVKMDQEAVKRLPSGFEGALPVAFFYEAFVDTVKKWYKARILSCRLARGNPLAESDSSPSLPRPLT
jgi:hypothetical protein